MLSGNEKNLYTFPDFSCMQRRMCVHAHYIPGRRNSCQVLYGEQRTAKEPPKSIFFSGLEGNVDLLQSQYKLTTFT